MSCSAKIYKGDEGGSRVILMYGNDSPQTGPSGSPSIFSTSKMGSGRQSKGGLSGHGD